MVIRWGRTPKMKKVDLQKHKFDTKVKLVIFFGLLILAGFLESIHSSIAGEVVGGVIVLAGGKAIVH